MSRLKVVGMLVTLGSIAIVTVLTSQVTRATTLPMSPVPKLAPYTGASAPTFDITCEVNITTTSSIPYNYTPETAAMVANYSGLALVPSPTYPVSPTQPTPVPAR